MFWYTPIGQLAFTDNTTTQGVTNVAAALAEFDTGTGTPTSVSEGGVVVSAAASTITVPASGMYHVTLGTRINPATADTIYVAVDKNGSTVIGSTVAQQTIAVGWRVSMAITLVVSCVGGDVITPVIWQAAAGPTNHTIESAVIALVRIA